MLSSTLPSLLSLLLVAHLSLGCSMERPLNPSDAAGPTGRAAAKTGGAGDRDPEAVWADLLRSLRAADRAAIQRLTTAQGFQDLTIRANGVRLADEELRRLGAAWSTWQLRPKGGGEQERSYLMGPEIKEHTLVFSQTADGWRLARWHPGY